MKFNITRDWCARMAAQEDGADIRAGVVAIDPSFEGKFGAAANLPDEPNIAFGRFIALMRRNHKLTVEILAQKADVDVLELIEIEDDTRHRPELRTVYQLANYFGIERPKLMQIAGLTAPRDASLHQEAVKFAARSESVDALTAQESAALEAFVAILSKK
ncbi:MAG: helix-turn-helix transcriptional regulator [bacterium]|nr:helix-turn-helix transcriptional regulator [bacterium]